MSLTPSNDTTVNSSVRNPLIDASFSARRTIPSVVLEFKQAIMDAFSKDACGVQFHYKGELIGLYQSNERPKTDIASCTKSLVALAIFKSFDLGYLDLDTPITEYLPPWEHLKTHGYDKITVRHLLTHTSGLPGNKYFLPKSKERCIKGDDQFFNGLAHHPGFDRNLRASLWPLLSAPGKKYDYSNPGTQLLAAVLASALKAHHTGLTVRQFVHQEIFTPLGMHNSSLTNDDRVTKFNGGMISTAEDLAALGQFIIHALTQRNNPILKRSTLEEMLSTPLIKGSLKHYAHLWWKDVNPDVFSALGDNGNLVIAFPNQRIAISRTQHATAGLSDSEYIRRSRAFWRRYRNIMSEFGTQLPHIS